MFGHSKWVSIKHKKAATGANIPTLLLTFTLLAGPAVYADFSFEAEGKMTGGTMWEAMGKVSQPWQTRTVYKGSRMAVISADQIVVTDLDAETITTITPKKKRYSVVTFEQERQYKEKKAAKTKKKSNDQRPKMDSSVKVRQTGKTREFGGTFAREVEARIPTQGQNGAMEEILMMTWVADPVAGCEEMENFSKRYAEALALSTGPAAADMAGGIAEIQKEVTKIKGIPLLQIISVGAPGHETGKEVRQLSSGGLTIERTITHINTLEMTIIYKNYSNAAVDPSLVDTAPAAFKRVKSDVEKALK